MKNKSTLVFTGDIGFDRYMYGKWDDSELISDEVLGFLHSADHVVANVEGPVAPVETNTTKETYNSEKETDKSNYKKRQKAVPMQTEH